MVAIVGKLIAAAAGALVGAAVAKELDKPSDQRGWHGEVGGVPYDFRRPTADKLRRSAWDPDNPEVFVPHAFGVGWSINFARLAEWIQPPPAAESAPAQAELTPAPPKPELVAAPATGTAATGTVPTAAAGAAAAETAAAAAAPSTAAPSTAAPATAETTPAAVAPETAPVPGMASVPEPETTVVPGMPTVPESAAGPGPVAVPEPVAASETVVTPEAVAAPETLDAPGTVTVPEAVAEPETAAVPITPATTAEPDAPGIPATPAPAVDDPDTPAGPPDATGDSRG